MDFGNRLKSLRQERQETLHKVAVGANIDMTLLSKFERRERMPTSEQLEKIARYFGADLTRLTVELTAEKIVTEYGANAITYQAAHLVKEACAEYNAGRGTENEKK
jgi:transcriptional regulator with XRE-family HTH domain